MNDFKSFPIVTNKSFEYIIKMYGPDIDFYLSKIKNLEYFSMIRLADWWWDTLLRAICKINPSFNVVTDAIVLNNESRNKIGQYI